MAETGFTPPSPEGTPQNKVMERLSYYTRDFLVRTQGYFDGIGVGIEMAMLSMSLMQHINPEWYAEQERSLNIRFSQARRLFDRGLRAGEPFDQSK